MPKVYIDGDAFFQTGLDKELTQAIPAIADQVETARNMGGDIEVPTADMVTAAAANPRLKALYEHTRTSVDGLTPHEAKEVRGQQLEGTIEEQTQKAIVEMAEQAKADSPMNAVRADILEQLNQVGGIHTRSDNAFRASLIARHFQSVAEQMNLGEPIEKHVTAESLYRQHRAKIIPTELAGDESLHQWQKTTMEAEAANWKEAIQVFKPGRAQYTATMRTPVVLSYLGEKSQTLKLSNTYANKIAEGHPDVPLEVLQNLPALIHDPIAAVPHTHGGVDIVLDATTENGEPIVAAVRDGEIKTITPVNHTESETGQEILRRRIKAALRTKAGEPQTKTYYRGDATNDEPTPNDVGSDHREAWRPQEAASSPTSARASAPLSLGELFRQRRNVITRDNLVKNHGERFYQGAIPEKIDVDGTQRHTMNSEGRPIANSEEELRNFWRWFGDSKAVDSEGRPLVVYHGTGSDFFEFDNSKAPEGTGDAHQIVERATPERQAATLDEAREQAGAFVGKEVTNDETGFVGMVSKTNLGKMTSESAVSKSVSLESHTLAVANADKLFRHATLDHSHPDVKGSSNIAAIHRFVAPMMMPNGEVLAVKITAKETVSTKEANPIYTIETLDVEKPVRMAPDESGIERVATGDAGSAHPTDGLVGNVADMVDRVKRAKDTLNQSQGAIFGFYDRSKGIIGLTPDANLSTFLHETGHWFLNMRMDMAANLLNEAEANGAPLAAGRAQMVADAQTLLKWFGVQDLNTWHALSTEEQRAYHEQFAEAFERYLYEGKAPSVETEGLFRRFKDWLLSVYKDNKDVPGVQLSPEVREVFDRMIATDEQINQMRQLQGMEAMFKTPEEAGMLPEAWEKYLANQQDSIDAASEEHGARVLRDTQFLSNLRNNMVKQLRQQSIAARRETRVEARTEVMSEPIYQLWAFLTGKINPEDRLPPERSKTNDTLDTSRDSLFTAIAKLGGIDRRQAMGEWGVDPAEKIGNPVFGKPVLRAKGGRTLDDMAQALAEHGYLPTDANGKVDLHDLESAFHDELHGNKRYSDAFDPNSAREMRPGDQVVNPDALAAGRLDIGSLREMYPPVRLNESDSVKYEMSKFLEGNPVASVPVDAAPFEKGFKAVRQWANEIFNGWGNKAVNPDIGEVILNDRSIRDTQGHGMTRDKSNALASVKNVIERGRVVLHNAPDKNRKYESIYISAPVRIGGVDDIVTVLVRSDENTKRMYLHSVWTKENLLSRRHNPPLLDKPVLNRSNDSRDIDTVLQDIVSFNHALSSDHPFVKILRERGMTAKDGALDPELVAEIKGFDSGDEMVKALLKAEPPEAAIEGLTDAMMLRDTQFLSNLLCRSFRSSLAKTGRRSISYDETGLTQLDLQIPNKRSHLYPPKLFLMINCLAHSGYPPIPFLKFSTKTKAPETSSSLE